MRKAFLRWVCLAAGWTLLWGGKAGLNAAEPLVDQWPASILTNLAQVRQWTSRLQAVGCRVDLEGVVVWVGRERDQLILASGRRGMLVRMDLSHQPPLHPGDRVRLAGQAVAGSDRLGEALVDNDGFHGPLERSGAIYLEAGRHPLMLDWFNGPTKWSLDIEYGGPGLPRQRIPATALFRAESSTPSATRFVPGLNYSCYQGSWARLPDFSRLSPIQSGVCTDFDLNVRTRDQNVGLQFSGFIDVPRSGLYTFWTRSDDGSRLYVERSGLRLTVLGTDSLPAPQAICPGQALEPETLGQWAEVEGIVRFSRLDTAEGLEVELTSGTNRMYLNVLEPSGLALNLASRIRARGLCLNAEWGGGLPTADRLVVPGAPHLEILEAAPNPPILVATNVDQLCQLAIDWPRANYQVRLEGTVLAASPGKRILALQDASAAGLIELPGLEPVPVPGQRISLQGRSTVENHRLILRPPALVENDGVHPLVEKSAEVFLNAGKHAVRVCWFNRNTPSGLTVYYQGPDLPRQKIPDSALFRQLPNPATGGWTWTSGVDYRSYEGGWIRVPDFSVLQPVESGSAPNFDITRASRKEEVGMEFLGYVEAPRSGAYIFSTVSDDGSLLFVAEQEPEIKIIGTNAVPAPQHLSGRRQSRERQPDQWAEAEGTVSFAGEQAGGLVLELNGGTGSMRVEVADSTGLSPARLLNSRVKAVGVCQSVYLPDGREAPEILLVPGSNEVRVLDVAPGQSESYREGGYLNRLPPLTTIEQVKALSCEQALRGYPVRIRGVITSPQIGGFFIQDSTGAIYVQWLSVGQADFPCVGDYWEVEGATYAEFAPNVRARRAIRLGPGRLPEPLRPAWDQLINGSLDTLYIELQGVLTDFGTNSIGLLTRDGKVNIQVIDMPIAMLGRYENALIRLRGCLLPGRDPNTLQVTPGQLGLVNVTLALDAPAPADPFAVALKHSSDLLRFDPQAGALQRVKIAGQVLAERQGVYYLLDGDTGLRFVPKAPLALAPGDQVEVVGFPELGGPSPLLHEALVRRMGRAGLPVAKPLLESGLVGGRQDATLVKVQARLGNLSRYRSEQVLELQTQARGFVARLDSRQGVLKALLPGSRLELTGVYSGLAGDSFSGRERSAFELLLTSPADVRVLEQPSWWKLRHTLAVLGGMAFIILGAVLWIRVLRRQVEERTRQLGDEIRRREHSEHRRVLEEDRARIARDLHDDLGANLTRIGLLGELVKTDESRNDLEIHARQIAVTARETVDALDEIVWAVNPHSDTLDSLLQYLSHYADKFFEETDIRCHLDFPIDIPPQPLTAEIKHSLFLVVKEALNNVLRHSAATQVTLRARLNAAALEFAIEDNGRGFAPPGDPQPRKRSGLGNMRQRLDALGGSLRLESRPEHGTRVMVNLPLGFRPAPF